MNPAGALNYEVFVSDALPYPSGERTPYGDPRMWSPISSTLIFGHNDAVLVDPPLTIAQSERVATWIEGKGRHLRHIFVTHGHGDHWLGAAPLLQRFAGATVFASPDTIEVMRRNGSPQSRAQIYDRLFPGQIADTPVRATSPPDNAFELEGRRMQIVEVGHSDTDETTVLHVPSIDLVVAGDVVYNGVHQYLAESVGGGLLAWKKALDIVALLRPRRVVAGHKSKALEDDPRTIDETRRYLEDADRLHASSHSAREMYEAMLALHPDRLNRSALWYRTALVFFPAG